MATVTPEISGISASEFLGDLFKVTYQFNGSKDYYHLGETFQNKSLLFTEMV